MDEEGREGGENMVSLPFVRSDSVWSNTIEKVIPAIVCIEFMTLKHFETFKAGSSKATGFVVDSRRGIILTNRHVVRAGPVEARAKFHNLEEVALTALWCDPMHDFGFYQYNPSDLKFQGDNNFSEVKLDPTGAQIGTPVRVLGNDAGEKLSILSGILAKLDRAAPTYGTGKYNDHNTFYYQAASMTSGGSSGSPVINENGNAIALNAGGSKRAASSFFLPLDRPARALALLQDGKNIPRGTLQTIFHYETFDELRRLGLDPSIEEVVRSELSTGTGMLKVIKVLPLGPADGLLEPGDIIVHINGCRVLGFIALETILDNEVGNTVTIHIDRGGKEIVYSILVQDLYEITPSSYLDFGGGVLNPLSYQHAICYDVPVRGIVVSASGYLLRRSGITERCIIEKVGSTLIDNLKTFEEIITSYPQGTFVPIQYWCLDSKQTKKIASIRLDVIWHRYGVGNKINQGHWEYREFEMSPEEFVPPSLSSTFPLLNNATASRLSKSLVLVKFSIPYQISGVPSTQFTGSGILVDTKHGLLIVDKETVPYSLGDISLVFAGSIEIPGKVAFVHPIQNFAVVSYQPTAVDKLDLEPIVVSSGVIDVGVKCLLIGLNQQGRVVKVSSSVTQIEALSIPFSAQFRATSVEVIHVDHKITTLGGVLCSKSGEVQALWQSFRIRKDSARFYGSPIDIVMETVSGMIQAMDRGEELSIQSLETELRLLPEYQARHQGLSQVWADKLEEHDINRKQVLQVRRTVANSPAAGILKEGDLVMEINKNVVSRFQEVSKAIQDKKIVSVTLLRDAEEMTLEVPTVTLGGMEPKKLVIWAGAFIQESYRELLLHQNTYHPGVYITRYFLGSPAEFYGVKAACWILDVNGIKTPNLDTFLDAVTLKYNTSDFLRITTINVNDKKRVMTLKPNHSAWPTISFEFLQGHWNRTLY